MATPDRSRGVLRQFFSGVGVLGQGFTVWRTAPGLMVLGLVPAVIVAALFIVAIIALGLNLDVIVRALTPFASKWDYSLRVAFRILIGVAFAVSAVLFIVNTFTTITLIIGQPFYERIWRHVEARSGEVSVTHDTRLWAAALRGVTDGLRMLAPTVLAGVALFVLGFIPVVGTILAAILGALVGGWFLATELTGPAFESRGKTLSERRRALKTRRPQVIGFGLASYLVFLVPLGAVVMMPVAVAGAAILSRQILDGDTHGPNEGPSQTTS